uniref:Uncharacterized protein n=1 Tax=Pyramimonas obovata TaxID=1411642 RepID=A0A7S0RVF5_9CHLO|mmetsp:Transcript_6433/g.13059  ORF Transcript_6433/g.13059 Transcript_6433/m.13059 type:complete len:306 (+) Transcript_6433:244-1161(+)|eukprot:CAMPEP_0118924022 /NCGR_PEP_ID=MMETSP1169-20130426/2339_1 /TAXON_ID=36882 /ORGANISM="Pyramimonas obovata, Strain CCMP722" /LENGTH=305 /DNA_ID=CAMNT_0006865097 /DNA_START=240 /DNA_END=1157 /DNA_ORIENTATION=+
MNLRASFIVLFAFTGSCHGGRILVDVPANENVSAVSARPYEPWDYMMLVQQWPVELCEMSGRSHNCVLPPKGWTIHGLWPDYDPSKPHTARYPQYCDNTIKFTESKVADLETKLDSYWPNCFLDTPHTDLWKHEFEKHGTCAMESPKISDEHDYFSTALKLREEIDFGAMFEKAGIVPSASATYTLEQVVAAVKEEVGFEPWLECSHSRGKQGLWQVGLCIDKSTLSPIACDQQTLAKGTCSSRTPLRYLPMPARTDGEIVPQPDEQSAPALMQQRLRQIVGAAFANFQKVFSLPWLSNIRNMGP